MTAVLQAAKKALPPAPTGWVILGDDQISVGAGLCRDYEAAPWNYSFNRSYQRVDDQEARNKILADAAAGSYKCVDATSHDPGQTSNFGMGKVTMEIRFTAGS